MERRRRRTSAIFPRGTPAALAAAVLKLGRSRPEILLRGSVRCLEGCLEFFHLLEVKGSGDGSRVESAGEPSAELEETGHGYHRGIVRGELEFGDEGGPAAFLTF